MRRRPTSHMAGSTRRLKSRRNTAGQRIPNIPGKPDIPVGPKWAPSPRKRSQRIPIRPSLKAPNSPHGLDAGIAIRAAGTSTTAPLDSADQPLNRRGRGSRTSRHRRAAAVATAETMRSPTGKLNSGHPREGWGKWGGGGLRRIPLISDDIT